MPYSISHTVEDIQLLLKITDGIHSDIDSGRPTIVIALDMSGAFDTIDHNVITRRLQHTFGLCGSALNCIRSYLDDRKSFVRWGSGQSATTGSNIGVPQGSYIGSLLFSFYVAPLAKVTQSFGARRHQYADDTYLSFSITKSSGPLESTKSSNVQMHCTTGCCTTASRSTYPSPKMSSSASRRLDLRMTLKVSTLLLRV